MRREDGTLNFPGASYDAWKTRTPEDEFPHLYPPEDDAPPAYMWHRAVEFWTAKGCPENVDRYEPIMGVFCSLPESVREGQEPVPLEIWRIVHPASRVLLEEIIAFAKSGGFRGCPRIEE